MLCKRHGILLLASLALLLGPLLGIGWVNYKPSYYKRIKYKRRCYYAMIPAKEHPDRKDSNRNITLYVRKFATPPKIATKRIIWLLAGGPGQSAQVFEHLMDMWDEAAGPESILILMDHRGVGRSTRPSLPEEEHFLRDMDKYASQSPIEPTAITILNAAIDVVGVAKLLQKEHPHLPQFIYGASYGTKWAMTVANLAPHLFTALLLEGTVHYHNWLEGEILTEGDEILANCRRDPFCRSKAGPDPERLFKLIPKIVTEPERNDCVRSFLTSISIIDAQRCPSIETFFRMLVKVEMGAEFAKRRLSARMLLLPLLLHLEECSDLERMRQLMAHLITVVLKDRLLPTQEAQLQRAQWNNPFSSQYNWMALSPGGEEKDRADLTTHAFVNVYINASEARSVQQPSHCEGNCVVNGLMGVCQSIGLIHGELDTFKNHLPPLAHQTQAPINAPNLQLYMVQGALDYRTPARGAYETFKVANVKHRRYHEFLNAGHEVLRAGGCERPIVREFLGIGKGSEAKSCVDRLNALSLDWNGTANPEYSIVRFFPQGEVKGSVNLKGEDRSLLFLEVLQQQEDRILDDLLKILNELQIKGPTEQLKARLFKPTWSELIKKHIEPSQERQIKILVHHSHLLFREEIKEFLIRLTLIQMAASHATTRPVDLAEEYTRITTAAKAILNDAQFVRLIRHAAISQHLALLSKLVSRVNIVCTPMQLERARQTALLLVQPILPSHLLGTYMYMAGLVADDQLYVEILKALRGAPLDVLVVFYERLSRMNASLARAARQKSTKTAPMQIHTLLLDLIDLMHYPAISNEAASREIGSNKEIHLSCQAIGAIDRLLGQAKCLVRKSKMGNDACGRILPTLSKLLERLSVVNASKCQGYRVVEFLLLQRRPQPSNIAAILLNSTRDPASFASLLMLTRPKGALLNELASKLITPESKLLIEIFIKLQDKQLETINQPCQLLLEQNSIMPMSMDQKGYTKMMPASKISTITGHLSLLTHLHRDHFDMSSPLLEESPYQIALSLLNAYCRNRKSHPLICLVNA